MCESYDAARGCQCYRACALRDEPGNVDRNVLYVLVFLCNGIIQ